MPDLKVKEDPFQPIFGPEAGDLTIFHVMATNLLMPMTSCKILEVKDDPFQPIFHPEAGDLTTFHVMARNLLFPMTF